MSLRVHASLRRALIMSDPPRLYTPKDVAKMLQVSLDTVRRMKDEGALNFVRVRDQIRFRREDLDAYINAQVQRSRAPRMRRPRPLK